MKEKLDQAPAFPFYNQLGNIAYWNTVPGMSKRFYAACEYANVANDFFQNDTVNYICEMLGIKKDEYNPLIHYPMAVVKLQYIFADELLKQESE